MSSWRGAGDANFCPECGADLKGVRGALSSPAKQGARSTGQKDREGGGGVAAATEASGGADTGRLSPAIIWGAFAVLAVVVVVVVMVASGGSEGGATGGAATADQTGATVTPIEADTSGSFTELVDRANGLYDQGQAKFQAEEYEQGSAYFQAAARVYAAAWADKQATAGVGTDYATSLFYSGEIDQALKQIEKVIAKFPDFQSAFFNKGNYLAHESRIAEQSGDTDAAKEAMAEAKAAYTKAISIDPESEIGKAADEQLRSLQ